MGWWQILGIAFGLAMDAFAVSIASGLAVRKLTGGHVFRISFHFGLFQFLMPIIGWLAGRSAHGYLASAACWLAAALLVWVGGKMLWDAIRREEEAEGNPSRPDPSRGMMLVTLSVATSLDALAVGMSMGLLKVSVWAPSIVIGLVAGLLSLVGITFGSRIGKGWGRRAEVLGGLVLLAIAARVLVGNL